MLFTPLLIPLVLTAGVVRSGSQPVPGACLTKKLFCSKNTSVRLSMARAGRLPTVTVHAPVHAYQNVIVSVPIPATTAGAYPALWTARPNDGSPAVIAQTSEQDGQTRLTFLVADLPQGATRVYRFKAKAADARAAVIQVKPDGDDLGIYIRESTVKKTPAGEGGGLFTRYTTHSGPNKPFFYPILTPDGQSLTRRWPMEPDSTESHDHPHHRGLWFTHGDINGIDFWSEQENPKVKLGKTVARGYENIVSGPVFGSFRTRTEWRAPDSRLIATDVRDVRVYRFGQERVMDFEITIKPESEPLVWGDTKEGMFGLRLPDTMAPNPDRSAHIATPAGHIEAASGQKDGAVWGKPNDWVDYYGPIGGKIYGVALFDNTQNLRHPETWHARDYGLFTINPFGLHDFSLGEKGAGSYTQPVDKTLTFRYRLLFHKGDTLAAHVADQYRNYTDPPEVLVKD